MAMQWSKILATAIISSLAFVGAAAQSSKKGPAYDPSKEVKIKGTVTEVQERSGTEAIVIVVKTADKAISVRLAPAEFLKEIDCWIKTGDQVEVTGAKVP